MYKPTNTGQETGDALPFGLNKYWDEAAGQLRWAYIEQQNWAAAMAVCPQDPLFHAEGDVWTHTKMVVAALQALPEYAELSPNGRAILSLAALWHDIAKPECTIINEAGRIISPKHAKIGEQQLQRLIWDVDFEARQTICALVRLHGLPLWAMEKPLPNAAVISASLRINTHWLYVLAKADVLGRICEDQEDLLLRCEFFVELCKENECYGAPKKFINSHSKFKFFAKQENYVAEIFDDTEFEVCLLSGLPASGKDYYAAEMGWPVVSLDAIRKELKISAIDKSGQGQVQQLAYERAKEFCRKKKSFIWNSTNLSHELRSKLITTLSVYNPKFRIVYLQTSWRETLAARSEYIPEAALERMLRLLEMPTPDEAHELEFRIRN